VVACVVRCRFTFLFVLLPALAAEAQPTRIVSTLPSATETLFALGVGDRVVGVSQYCHFPPDVLSLPKVGTYTKPDAEKIVLLRPDLVVISTTGAGLADRLSGLSIRTVAIRVGSLPEVFSMIHDIGAAAGVLGKAEHLNDQIRSRLENLRVQGADRPKPSVLMIVGRTPGLLNNLTAAGASTYLSELLQIAGGANALAASAISYPRISLETIVRLNPDVILDMSIMGEAMGPPGREERLRETWLSHRELTAVTKGNVFGLASETLVTPGPRVAEAVEEIRARLGAAIHQKVAR
jgi:iron complex transport system substrate-binding protein